MSQWDTSVANIKIAGAVNPIVQSFSINLENPVQYLGAYEDGGKIEPQAISLAIPEFSASYDATMKYDDNTDNLDA